MGRPAKSDKRDRQLNVSLTAEELSSIVGSAARFGMRAVDYARWLILEGGKVKALPVPAGSRIDRLAVLQLQRLGNLLNQLVRGLHRNAEAPLQELRDLLQEIRVLIRREFP